MFLHPGKVLNQQGETKHTDSPQISLKLHLILSEISTGKVDSESWGRGLRGPNEVEVESNQLDLCFYPMVNHQENTRFGRIGSAFFKNLEQN